jgi:DNA polymerase alpha subunit B
LAKVEAHPPDVLILLGPFVDVRHPMVASGKTFMEIESDEDENEDDQLAKGKRGLPKMKKAFLSFENVLKLFCLHVGDVLENHNKAHLVMIPSTTIFRAVFPQPPLELPGNAFEDAEIKSRIVLLPNPSVFSVNEIVIGVSTMDVLSHLVNEDIRSPSVVQAQSLGLAEHLIQQRSFCPLAEGAPV